MVDQSKKKIAIAVICILVAVGVFAYNYSRGQKGGLESLEPGVKFLMMCRECGHTFEIERKEYYRFIEQDALQLKPMPCPACEKDAAYLAHECPKCGNVFFDGAAGEGTFPDQCPKCGYSQRRQDRLNAK